MALGHVPFALNTRRLCRVPVIRELAHLAMVLAEFEQYHNHWRAHSTIGGALPALVHACQQWQKPDRTAKRVPAHIERRFFSTARATACRLPEAA